MAIPLTGFNAIAPASNAIAVTPSDTTNFPSVTKAIYVGGTGNVVVVMAGTGAVTFPSVPAGAVLPVQAIRVNSTSTTATNMVALY